MKENTDKQQKGEFVRFVVIISFVIFVGISSYLILGKISKSNGKVCNFLGDTWLIGDPSDPSVRRGCFGYRELYE